LNIIKTLFSGLVFGFLDDDSDDSSSFTFSFFFSSSLFLQYLSLASSDAFFVIATASSYSFLAVSSLALISTCKAVNAVSVFFSTSVAFELLAFNNKSETVFSLAAYFCITTFLKFSI